MIIYFSATGNTEFIAKQLSERINDDSLNLINRIKEKDYSPIGSSAPFVIYFVFTSGGYTGISGFLAQKLIKKKGMT